MMISYASAISMVYRQPIPQIGWEVKVYNQGWKIIKESGKDIQTIRNDLKRELTVAEISYLNM